MTKGKGGSSGMPEGWRRSTVGEACEIQNNLRLPISVEEREKIEGEYPYYGPTGILSHISEYRAEGKYALIGEDGDHFLKYDDRPMTLLVEGKFNINNHAHVVRGTADCSTEWFYFYFMHQPLTPYLTRQGAGRYKLNKAALEKLPLVLPPLEKQRKITEILSTWDEAIEQQTRLVELRRERKRGLMQQLLTGRVRFREFAGLEWKNIELNEIIEVNPRKQLDGLSFVGEFVEMASVSEQGQLEHVAQTELSGSLNGFTAFCNDDVLVAKITPCFENGKGAFVFGLRGLGLGSTEFHILRARSAILPLYLYFLTRSYEFQQRGKASMQGSGGQQRVPTDFIKKFPVSLPPLPEQQKIATVLSAADAEIDTLTVQLAALKTQKRGLMQRLLTGQTRVSVA